MQQMSTLLTSGEAWAGIWAVDRVAALTKSAHRRLRVPGRGREALRHSIGIIKGTKVPELAARLREFRARSRYQGPFCEAALLTPTNSKVKWPLEVQPFVPSPAVSTSSTGAVRSARRRSGSTAGTASSPSRYLAGPATISPGRHQPKSETHTTVAFVGGRISDGTDTGPKDGLRLIVEDDNILDIVQGAKTSAMPMRWMSAAPSSCPA